MHKLIVYSPDGHTAEVGVRRYGFNMTTGENIHTSQVVKIDNRTITTLSGSKYLCVVVRDWTLFQQLTE
jgi:hypothetical protein